MKYRLAIFDMDGTILNTMTDILACWNRTLELMGMEPLPEPELRRYVGYSIEYVIEKTMPEGTPPEVQQKFLELYAPYFKLHNNDKTCEFPGITALLRELRAKGILTAVVSNNSHPAVTRLCSLHFPGLFDSIVGAEGMRAKPAPDTIYAALERLGIAGEDAIFVGDGETDIMAAINAGIDNVAVLWGYRTRDVLESYGAKTFVSTVDELKELILKD